MRKEFTTKTRAKAFARCNGKCQKCGKKLMAGDIFYDHVIPDGLGGDNSLENCQVLCKADHASKTVTEDNPIMEKADRIRKKHFGIKKSAYKWPSRKFGS